MNYLVHNPENIQMVYLIDTKIDVLKTEDYSERCALCNERSHKYCENEKQFYCEKCDMLAHNEEDNENSIYTVDEKLNILRRLRQEHVRVDVQDARVHKFGYCEQHRYKENEYYDKHFNSAFCSICAIEKAQERKNENSSTLIPINDAYNIAKDRALKESDDHALENKKLNIKNKMDQIQNQINIIKQQAMDAQ